MEGVLGGGKLSFQNGGAGGGEGVSCINFSKF